MKRNNSITLFHNYFKAILSSFSNRIHRIRIELFVVCGSDFSYFRQKKPLKWTRHNKHLRAPPPHSPWKRESRFHAAFKHDLLAHKNYIYNAITRHFGPSHPRDRRFLPPPSLPHTPPHTHRHAAPRSHLFSRTEWKTSTGGHIKFIAAGLNRCLLLIRNTSSSRSRCRYRFWNITQWLELNNKQTISRNKLSLEKALNR